MDHFESSLLVGENSSHPPIIPSFPFLRRILETDVRYFKDFEGEWKTLVFSDSLEETGEEGGTDDLEFDSGGIEEFDSCRAVVFSVEEFEVFVVRALLVSIAQTNHIGALPR